MSEKRTRSTARIQVTLEITTGDSWSADCQLSQVYRQGAETAMNYLREVLKLGDNCNRIRIVGEPTVTAVLANEPK